MTKTFTHTIEAEGEMNEVIELEVEFTVSWGEPARIDCLPENAEPATHDELEIINVKEIVTDSWGGVDKLEASDELFVQAEEAADELIEAAIKEISE